MQSRVERKHGEVKDVAHAYQCTWPGRNRAKAAEEDREEPSARVVELKREQGVTHTCRAKSKEPRSYGSLSTCSHERHFSHELFATSLLSTLICSNVGDVRGGF